ncbi:hypothetical protein B0T26DRAFT_691346 [Lasiosphaeria miniovina]|uniref:Uncharacterized protein n=1 Tax=Lasiosphaeria miniovina TaxID=1954250 RepID=A0AA40BJF4_9PEZI|nr:uncharacterized protein B0T26DRAFT_691346 [Lasiosphaeria miniovina]KAK0735281.1 hypothetical protein B0T26DRAFT_691346 [Lasiosphaeria miniovina]
MSMTNTDANQTMQPQLAQPAPQPSPPTASEPSDAAAQEALQAARYARTGIKPPRKLDSRRRFKNFIDRINRRQWETLGEGIHRRLAYNGRDMSQYELIQHLKQEFAPKTHTTMEIVALVGGKTDEDGSIGARLRVKHQVVQGPYLTSAARRRFEYARHMFVQYTAGKISEISDIPDEDERRREPKHILPPPGLRPPPPRVSIDLGQFYTDYIACINGGNMTRELQRFCKSTGVTWNGSKLAVDQYRKLMEGAFDAIDGLKFIAHTVLVDEARQQIAVRIDFIGTPVKPFGGAFPNGKQVIFSEHAFYWLEQGKISDVLTIVDWESYKSQLIH